MSKPVTPDSKKKKSHPEARGLMLIAGSLLTLLCLLSFEIGHASKNWLGLIGYFLSFGLTYLFGLTPFFAVVYVGWLGWKLITQKEIPHLISSVIYFSIFCISCCLLLNLLSEAGLRMPHGLESKTYTETVQLEFPYPHRQIRHNLGGVPFYLLYRDLPTLNLQRLLSDVGIGITFSVAAMVSLLLATQTPIIPLLKKLANGALFIRSEGKRVAEKLMTPKLGPLEKQPPAEIEKRLTKVIPQPLYESEPIIRTHAEREEMPKPTKRQAAISAQKIVNGDYTTYKLPSPNLLSNGKKVDHPSLKKELRRQAEILEETLMSFGIEAKVGEINCGPTITSFEVHPAIGVKVQKIKTLENDIALNLQAKSIRIIAPIPGKAAVGVEIPSLYPQEVSFKEMLLDYQQSPRKLFIPVLLGKNVTGENVVSDLAKMPHCIIAGATGSGKSVCINTLIMSILMNARPDEIKMIMIDPKKVELTPYSNLPHLIAPVITEPHGAYAALNWLVKEMQTRYDILKQIGARNISAFNTRQINKEFESSLSIPIPERMYGIVAIIDEFADLMMASNSDLETPIARIAQMARAVGIHLVLATQRPSREVITGLIKANFPTRIAFKVASRINSQIILDDTGAESLLGNGDMLFLPPGTSTLMRAQGVYISDEDINRVMTFITTQAPPNYLIPSFDNMRREGDSSEGNDDESPRDSLYDQALATVLETRTASTTFLQRKLKIGYARAASLMDELEAKGVISAQEGSKPRRILIQGNGSNDAQKNNAFEYELDLEQ